MQIKERREGKYWTKAELDGLFQLESVNGKTLLPIWHKLTKKEVMDYSPIIASKLAMNNLYCVGISSLVKDREAIFLADLEQVQIVDPAEVKLVADNSPFYKRAFLYLESQWRQQIPTDANLHIGHQAAMDLMPPKRMLLVRLASVIP